MGGILSSSTSRKEDYVVGPNSPKEQESPGAAEAEQPEEDRVVATAGADAQPSRADNGDDEPAELEGKPATPAGPSPPTSTPSTPPGAAERREPSVGSVLADELHGLTASLRRQELAVLQLSQRRQAHRQAKREFHSSLGAVGALESLWPDSVPPETRAACRFDVASVQLRAKVDEGAVGTALSRGTALRYTALRRRRLAIDQAEGFLVELESAATADTVRKLVKTTDAKTRFQRRVRAEATAAAREREELTGALAERREAKLLMHQAGGAWEFGDAEDNGLIIEAFQAEACRAAMEEQEARLGRVDADWSPLIKASKQRLATVREQQRVLDTCGRLRVTEAGCAEARLQLAQEKLWIESELATLGPEREVGVAAMRAHQEGVGAMQLLNLLRQSRSTDGAWMRKHVLPADPRPADTQAIEAAVAAVTAAKRSQLAASVKGMAEPSDSVVAVVQATCCVLGEAVPSWDAAQKLLATSLLKDRLLAALDEMADTARSDAPLDASGRRELLVLVQELGQGAAKPASKGLAVLYAFVHAAEAYCRTENRCEDLRDLRKLEAETGVGEKRMALADRIGRIPRGESAKQVRF